MATDNQIINKVWSEDTTNKASFTEDEVGAGIVYQGPIVSSQLNGLGNLTTKALKYLQRTGGYWNAAMSYTAGDFVNILQYQKSGTLTLTTYRCVKANTNQPPYTGTKQGTGDTPLFLYGGAVNSAYWSKVSYTGEGQDSEYVTRFTNQNVASAKWISPEINLTNKININGADTTFTTNSTDTLAALHFSQKGADPLNSERGALLVDKGVSLQAYPGRENAGKVKGLWDVNLDNSTGASNDINDINNVFFGIYDIRTSKAAGDGPYAGIRVQHNYDAAGYFNNPNSYNYSVELKGQTPYNLGDTGYNIATFNDLSKVYSQISLAPRQQFQNEGSNQIKWSTYKSALANLKPNYIATQTVASNGYISFRDFTGTPYNLYTLLNSAGMLTDIDIGDITNPKVNPLVWLQLSTNDWPYEYYPDVFYFFNFWDSKNSFTIHSVMGTDMPNRGYQYNYTTSNIVPLFQYVSKAKKWRPTTFIWCNKSNNFSNWIKCGLNGLTIRV